MYQVGLAGSVSDMNGISLLRAEWWDPESRFVLVRYADHGEEQALGLRLDLDKRVFLDHVEDALADQMIQESVKAVWDAVVKR
ncbi:MAG: hypothetical protein P4M00_05895 [Azospirillaceae bacterium]|nr:hypothetical protein [Azospirillaceae bacterium]